GSTRRRLALRIPRMGSQAVAYAGALGVVVLSTAVCAWAGGFFDLADQTMTYLLGVLLVATRLPRRPSLLAPVTSVPALDFFFVPPLYAFTVLDAKHLVTFGVMLVVGLLVSGLTLRIREQASLALERERQIEALYALSQKLAVTGRAAELAHVA